MEYTDPTTGSAPYSTMTFFANMLRPTEQTLPSRQTASLIYTVLEGNGHSMIGEQRFDWEPFDTFCVPGGEWVHHVNETPGTGGAIFFVSSDEPVLKSLYLYSRHGKNEAGEVVLLESSRKF